MKTTTMIPSHRHLLACLALAVILPGALLSAQAPSAQAAAPAQAQATQAQAQATQAKDLPEGLYALIETTKGPITLRLDYLKAPLTVTNFVGLAEGSLDASKGRRFYDGLTFHRVVADFVIQGGDPRGDGSGGPGYKFPNEISSDLRHDAPGVLAMANAGPDTNGSQFYITLAATPFLDGKYNVFGRVVSGMDTVRTIAIGDKMNSVTIIRIGNAAKAFVTDQAAFDARRAALAGAAKAAATPALLDKAAALSLARKTWPGLAANPDETFSLQRKAGTGKPPASGSTAVIAYTAMFLDGKVFDQSAAYGGLVEVQVGVNRIIPGIDRALMSMGKGEKRLIVLPPALAFGSKGVQGLVPPDSWVAYELELSEIK
ncbi:MAG: peptidylprolyl isomerase [Spirochaetota bacterium]